MRVLKRHVVYIQLGDSVVFRTVITLCNVKPNEISGYKSFVTLLIF